MITVPRSSPAARNRYLHLPERRGLLPIPSSIFSFATSPLALVILPALLRDVLTFGSADGASPIHASRSAVLTAIRRRR